jgi:hypothetical protein
MLRHVGVTRGQVLSILALEGGALTALGIATGFVLGLGDQPVLVFVVNPQSFHWTMQLHLPWPLIASVAGALLTAAPHGSSRAARRCPRPDTRRQGGLVMRRVFILSLALALPAASPRRPPSPPSPRCRLARPAPAARFRRPSRYKTEWWYATGWADAAGKPLGFQVTFFRSATATTAPTPAPSRRNS